jgi:Ring finger domain
MPVDGRLLAEGNLQWQAQLLANYSGHIFVSKGPAHLMQTVIESSLAILAMRAEIADLRLQNSTLTTASKRMEAEMEQMEDERREERRRRIQSFKDHASNAYRPASSIQINNAVAGPSRVIPPLPSRPPAYSPRSEENFLLPLDDPFSDGHNGRRIERNGNDTMLRELDPERESAEAAAQMQREFDEEDRRLRAQMEEITMNLQREFRCSVCLDEQLEDYVARLEPCGHCFCRNCIRTHVVSKITENRYPIFCPVCMAETETAEGEPGGT